MVGRMTFSDLEEVVKYQHKTSVFVSCNSNTIRILIVLVEYSTGIEEFTIKAAGVYCYNKFTPFCFILIRTFESDTRKCVVTRQLPMETGG